MLRSHKRKGVLLNHFTNFFATNRKWAEKQILFKNPQNIFNIGPFAIPIFSSTIPGNISSMREDEMEINFEGESFNREKSNFQK